MERIHSKVFGVKVMHHDEVEHKIAELEALAASLNAQASSLIETARRLRLLLELADERSH